MGILIAALFVAVELPTSGYRDGIVVQEASELVAHCREEATAYFVGHGRATHQWTASHKSRGNVLYVDGRLRVEGNDVRVACNLPRGARLTYMTLEVEKP
jgi:prepilin-type processing-associated H-X9-DG protein